MALQFPSRDLMNYLLHRHGDRPFRATCLEKFHLKSVENAMTKPLKSLESEGHHHRISAVPFTIMLYPAFHPTGGTPHVQYNWPIPVQTKPTVFTNSRLFRTTYSMYDVEDEVCVFGTAGTGLLSCSKVTWPHDCLFHTFPLSPTSCHPGQPSSDCQGEACWANRVAGTVCSHLLQCPHHLN